MVLTSESVAPILDVVLAVLRERRSIDFSRYRRAMVERRLAQRIAAVGAASPEAYVRLVRSDDVEVDRLVAQLTIKVSEFYRDGRVFEVIRDRVVPVLRTAFPEPLRVWSAGCGEGEEAYTLAMLTGDGAAVDATDIDTAALAVARTARYPPKALGNLPPELRRRFMTIAAGGDFAVTGDIRDRVKFLRHDLTAAAAAPAEGAYHLVCCRNVLIYFDRPTQQRALRLLVRSLLPGGVLCLGPAEWPADVIEELQVLDRASRTFRRRVARRESSR